VYSKFGNFVPIPFVYTGGHPYLPIQNPQFQLSTVYHSLKKIGKLTRPVLDSFSFIPIPTVPLKLVTILLLAFSLFELVATLSQCLCSESDKKNGEVGEYPQ